MNNLKDYGYIDCDAEAPNFGGMEAYENKKLGKLKWEDLHLELWQQDQQGIDEGISGHLLHKELQTKNALNANVLGFLLENPELIPEDWKDERTISFWGTIYINGQAGLCVQTLEYDERGWQVRAKYLDQMFGRQDYALLNKDN